MGSRMGWNTMRYDRVRGKVHGPLRPGNACRRRQKGIFSLSADREILSQEERPDVRRKRKAHGTEKGTGQGSTVSGAGPPENTTRKRLFTES